MCRWSRGTCTVPKRCWGEPTLIYHEHIRFSSLPQVNPALFQVKPQAACAAQGLITEKKVFDVHVEQGHMHNAKVVLRGEAGCSDPSMLPGDVVFVLEAKPHATFKRAHHDLIMEKVGDGCALVRAGGCSGVGFGG